MLVTLFTAVSSLFVPPLACTINGRYISDLTRFIVDVTVIGEAVWAIRDSSYLGSNIGHFDLGDWKLASGVFSLDANKVSMIEGFVDTVNITQECDLTWSETGDVWIKQQVHFYYNTDSVNTIEDENGSGIDKWYYENATHDEDIVRI